MGADINGGHLGDQDFPVDGTMSSAVNYCRPVGGGIPWCYVDTGGGFQHEEWCELTPCSLGT